MATITDELMHQMLAKSKEYTIAFLREGPNANIPNVQQTIWEHARRNFQLRSDGLLSIVSPITEESEIKGLYIFNVSKEKAKQILDEDPAVKEGIFTYEVVTGRSFPGDALQ